MIPISGPTAERKTADDEVFEINDFLAAKICRDLEIPSLKNRKQENSKFLLSKVLRHAVVLAKAGMHFVQRYTHPLAFLVFVGIIPLLGQVLSPYFILNTLSLILATMSKKTKTKKMKKSKSSAHVSARKGGIMPLGDRVLVLPIEPESITASGIIIPETIDKEKPFQGRVVAVGPGKWNEDGDARIPMGVKVGQKVIFSKYSPDEVKIDGKEYFLISESNILAVIAV